MPSLPSTDQVSDAIWPPAAICAAMVLGSAITHALGGPSPLPLLDGYVAAAFGCTVLCTLVYVFLRIIALWKIGADKPLSIVAAELAPKIPLLVLPIVISPIFLAAFTAAKSAIPTLVGFRYDHLLADLDAAVFLTDPWRITHMFIGRVGTTVIQFFYVAVWVSALALSQAAIPIFASRRRVGVFFTAMLLTWFVAGFLIAYALPAAGPVFVNMSDPSLLSRFSPLTTDLARLLPPGSPFLHGPIYLEEGIKSGTAYSGGGISAMPSMHIAVVTIYVLASRRTLWFAPACLFALIIFIGSIHSGYHYAMDAAIAIPVAILCWHAATKLHRRPIPSSLREPRRLSGFLR